MRDEVAVRSEPPRAAQPAHEYDSRRRQCRLFSAKMQPPENALALLEPNIRSADAPPCPYEPLVGSWAIAARWYPDGDGPRETKGEWHFSWILGGWGIQDVLFAAGAGTERRGTSIRCYDTVAAAWRVVWMMPASREFAALIARQDGVRIVQEGAALDLSSHQRWTFSDITENGFLWQGESSSDGSTWKLEGEMRGTRESPTLYGSVP